MYISSSPSSWSPNLMSSHLSSCPLKGHRISNIKLQFPSFLTYQKRYFFLDHNHSGSLKIDIKDVIARYFMLLMIGRIIMAFWVICDISLFGCLCLVGSKNTLGDQLRTVEFSRLALFLYPPFVKNDYWYDHHEL